MGSHVTLKQDRVTAKAGPGLDICGLGPAFAVTPATGSVTFQESVFRSMVQLDLSPLVLSSCTMELNSDSWNVIGPVGVSLCHMRLNRPVCFKFCLNLSLA